jgi:hypothetical protein
VLKRIPVRRAALVAAALTLSSLVPGLAAPASAEAPTVTLTGAIHNPARQGVEEDISLLDSQGAPTVDTAAGDDGAFTLTAPPGQYTLHLEAQVSGYSAGYRSGDYSAPGLFLDVPLDLTADTTIDLNVPIVDFPVHVVDRSGNSAPGVLVEGTSQGSVDLGGGVVGSGRLLNEVRLWTDGAGNATMQIFAGLAPPTVSASDGYEVLGQVSPAPSDTSAVVTLDNPLLQGDLLDPRGPLPAPAAAAAWVSFSGTSWAGQGSPWPYGVDASGHYRIQGPTGDRTLSVSNENTHDEDDGVPRPASATLPGTWRFEAPYHFGGDATLDLTVPDAAPADIVVLGADDQPATGITLQYSAVAQGTIALAPGVDAGATAADTITDVAGHLSPMLFGPSTMTYSVDGLSGTVAINPGDHLTLHLADQSDRPGPPQNVTATAGDSKVKVTWDPPASDGGSPITGYTVTASHSRSNTTASFGASAGSGTIRGLVNGKDYTVTVVAKNANGAGPASAPVAVTLDAAPPTTTTTAPGSGAGPGSGGDPLGGAGSGDGGGQPGAAAGRSGYWLLGSDGAVYPFGDAAPYGDASAALAAPGGAGALKAVDLEPTPSGQGYWILDSGGRVHPFGDAPHLGDVVLSRLAAGETPASLAATPTGAGYWVFTNRGRAIAFGDAAFLGDMSGTTLNGPVLDSVATPSGHGYYMVAADGGIFAFGDARFAGSMGGHRLNAPVRSLVPDGDGAGYWLVASDGGIFAFDAPFRGSMGGQRLNRPVQGMVRYGDGYLMVGEDGGVFTFSDRPFTGSLGSRPPAGPIVSVAAVD